MNSSIRKEKLWTYLIAFVIGVLSLPTGLFLGNYVLYYIPGYTGGLFQLLPSLLLMIILSVYYAYVRKESLLKILSISLLALSLISVAWLFIVAGEHGRYLYVDKLGTEPGQYVEITRNELTAFPTLIRAIEHKEGDRIMGGQIGYSISDKEWGIYLILLEKNRKLSMKNLI